MLWCEDMSMWIVGNVTMGDSDGSDLFWRLWSKNSALLKRMDHPGKTVPGQKNESLGGENWVGAEENLCSIF